MKKLLLVISLNSIIFLFFLININFGSAGETEITQCINNFTAMNMIPDNFNLNAGELSYESGVVLVGFKQGITETETEEILRSYNVSWDPTYTFGGSTNHMNYKLQFNAGKEFEIACRLKDNPSVQYAELNLIFTGAGGGNVQQNNSNNDSLNCTFYYWFDNNSTQCGYKEFCGTYMYQGLQSFETRGECESALNRNNNETGNEDGNKNESSQNKKNITFVPWQKRNESECLEGCKCVGAVMSCPTEDGKIMTINAGRSGNIITIVVNKTEVNTTLELEQEKIENENKTKLKAKLSSGRKAEIKLMPDTANERAIARLGELGFNITLKEVGNDKVVYELTGNKEGKFLGIFKIMAKVQAQVDAETGNVKVIKPWWSFLASGV